MTCTRDDLHRAAADLGWQRLGGTARNTDVYRNAPHSVMVDFSRDGSMIVEARLFGDAPSEHQTLPPRVLATVTKSNVNKHRRIRSWFYDYQTRSA